MELLIPDWNDVYFKVGACMTTRRGGYSAPPYDDGQGGGGLNLSMKQDWPQYVYKNRQLLCSILPAEPVWLAQVHGVNVIDAANAVNTPQADASITSRPGVVCAVLSADCLPVLLCDATRSVVGAAHAGWRGLAHGVLENTVQAMREQGAKEIIAWLGAAIGPQQFEVGQDVVDIFVQYNADTHAAFIPIAGLAGKYYADIYQLARLKLARVGIHTVYGGHGCTVSDASRFYSYRRDKRITGHMATLIWLK